MESMQHLLGPTRLLNVTEVLVAFSFVFVLSTIISTVYRMTHHGFSYSRVFVQAMLLASITSCLMIMVIGNNLARGLGILGALAIIRFRTPVRDPTRHGVFVLLPRRRHWLWSAGVLPSPRLVRCFSAPRRSTCTGRRFPRRASFEGLLRFLLPPDSKSHEQLQAIFERHLKSATLIAVREAAQGDMLEYSLSSAELLHANSPAGSAQ